MYTNIILTILVATLLLITILMVNWWRKYGKKIFGSISDIKNKTKMPDFKDVNFDKETLKFMINDLGKISGMFNQKKDK